MTPGQQAGGPVSRGMHLALWATALAWAAAAHAIAERGASGLTQRLNSGAGEALLGSIFYLFLLVVGLRMLDFVATRGRFDGEVLALPKRPGRWREWGVGAALGWGLCLVVVLPVLLSGRLHGHMARGGWLAISVALATLLVATLAQEVVFRGYAFRRLIAGVGPSAATLVMAVGFGLFLLQGNVPVNMLTATLDGTLLGVLLALGWLRTHGLWLGWGLNFAYRAVMGVALGLPIAGQGTFASLAELFASGPRWLTGGGFGLDAAGLTLLALLGAMLMLYRATREYAWQYTYVPIVAAGYEVSVAPPKAHVEMERAAAPPPLVQILPVAPPPPLPGGGAERDVVVP